MSTNKLLVLANADVAVRDMIMALNSMIIRQLVAKYDAKYSTKTKFILDVIS